MRSRNGALFVGVSLVSGFGSTAMSLVAGIWVLSLTRSASLAALAGFCVYVPTLAGPVLGALVDRLPRRRLLIWTDLTMAGALLLLFAVRSPSEVWLVYAVMLAYGVSYVLLSAGESALLPLALPRAALGRINGLRMSAQEGTKLVAPLAGAGLFTVAGGPAVATLAAAGLVGAAGLYSLVHVGEARPPVVDNIRLDPAGDAGPAIGNVRPEPVVGEPRAGPVVGEPRAGSAASEVRLEPVAGVGPESVVGTLSGQVRDGVRYLWSRPDLRAVVLVGSAAMFLSGLGTAARYAVVTAGLGRPAAFLGVLGSVQGAGSILSGLSVARLLARRGERSAGVAGALLFAAGLTAQSVAWLPAQVAGGLLVGTGLPWAVIAAMTAVQRHTPTELTGRVAATATTMVFGPPALGIPLGAVLVTLIPYRIALLLSAAGGVLAAAYGHRHRDRSDRS